MKLNSILLAVVCLATSVSMADYEAKLTMENDTFLKKDDSDYTHGTRFEVVDRKRGFHYAVQ